MGVPAALTEEEVAALMAAVGSNSPKALRDRAILELLYSTGMRISELTGLSVDDLHVDDTLRSVGQGGTERLVPVGRNACDALEAWLGPRGARP